MVMKTLKLQLTEQLYEALKNRNGRLEGSIGLINDWEANFNAYKRYRCRKRVKSMALPHGKASITDELMKLSLRIKLTETEVKPTDTMVKESRIAGDFFNCMVEFEHKQNRKGEGR